MANNNWLVIGAILFVAYLFVFPGNPISGMLGLGKDTTAPATTTPPVSTPGIICESATSPDLDITTYDLEDPGTALTGALNLYRKVGDTSWSQFTAGTAITNLQVGKDYEVVLGISTSNQTDIYAGKTFKTGPIPCAELTSMDIPIYNMDTAAGNTLTYYNKNHDNSREVFAAGDIKTVSVQLEASNDQVYGNPFVGKYSNVACMNLNSSTWDPVVKVSVGADEMKKVSTPLRHSTSAGTTTYCYEAPVVTENDVEYDIKLDADDSNAPNANVTFTIYPSQYYIDSNTATLASGVEDEDGNAAGTATGDTVSMLFD